MHFGPLADEKMARFLSARQEASVLRLGERYTREQREGGEL